MRSVPSRWRRPRGHDPVARPRSERPGSPPTRWRTLVAVGLAGTLSLAGCTRGVPGTWTDTPAAAPLPSASAGVAWANCAEEAAKILGSPLSGPAAQCGVVRVPQDWSVTGGPTFDVSLLRLPATSARRIGALLVNPGGPGASGVELAAYASVLLPAEIRQRFDVVGFDPRGVSRSTQVSCISDQAKDELTATETDPVEQDAFDAQVAMAREIGQGCGNKYRDTLGLFNTEQTARDMDAIRVALGESRTTFLGYSYGTLLGSVYAQLFPDKVRALVLDGAVDPVESDVVASEAQAVGFEKAFDAFAADCRQRSCAIGPDARAELTALMAKVRAEPVPGKGREKRTATTGYALLAVVSALYSQQQWPALATALDTLRAGDPSGVFALADSYNERNAGGQYSNQLDAQIAVNCADEDAPVSAAQIRELQSAWRTKYPLFGAPLALSMLSCTGWPAKSDPYPAAAAEGAPPILVVGTLGDPATPYANAPKLARMLGSGTVLTWEGEGHTAYPQTPCIRDAVNRYLIDLTVPPPDKRCPKS